MYKMNSKLKKLYSNDIRRFAKEQNWEGKGTKDDPYLVNSGSIFPNVFSINNSDIWICFKKCNFNAVLLKNCKNVSFQDCTFEELGMRKCSYYVITDSTFKRTLAMSFCNEIKLDNTKMSILYLSLCFNNFFNNCSIYKIINISSRGNVFKNNEIPDEYIDTIKESSIKNLSSILFYIGLAVISLCLIQFTNPFVIKSLFLTIILTLGLICFSLTWLFAIIHYRIKVNNIKKYPSNQIY